MASDVDTLLSQFIAEHEAGGEADPRAFLDQASPGERNELAALIDGYLMRAPRREFNAAAYEASAAPEVVEALSRSLQGAAGLWPSVLPRLRARARLKRNDLVAELAARLGAEASREKVGRYYHEMEQGLLPSEGVSDTVLEALGAIVGQSKQALRDAGRAFAEPSGEQAPAAAFARTRVVAEAASAPLAGRSGPLDEVDRLFRGG